MGSRTMPTECPHGRVVDWGDYGPDPDDSTVGVEACERCDAMAARIDRLGERQRAATVDPWRLAEWRSLPDVCGISGCDSDEADQRGPLFMRDGTMHKLCPEHWVAVFAILGEQATWERDAHRSPE